MALPGQPRILAMLLIMLTAASDKMLASPVQDAGAGQETSESSSQLASNNSWTSAPSTGGLPSQEHRMQVTVDPPHSSLIFSLTEESKHPASTSQSSVNGADWPRENETTPTSTSQIKRHETIPTSTIWTKQNENDPISTDRTKWNATTPAHAGQIIADQTKENETIPTSTYMTKHNNVTPAKTDEINPAKADKPNTTPASTDEINPAKADKPNTTPASTGTNPNWTVSISTVLISLASNNPSTPASSIQTLRGTTNEQRTPSTSSKASPTSQSTTMNTKHSPRTSIHPGIIVAVGITVFLLVVVMALALLCRRRHRSRSTNFNAGRAGPDEWAGPVTLPEEKGGGQAEDRGQEAKSGDSRRPTLTTFFGKRHSRVSSVAMEDMAVEKDGSPLSEPLLATGEQGGDPAPPGGAEANGTLPLTPDPPSPPSQPPANGEFPPPPPVEQEAMPPA